MAGVERIFFFSSRDKSFLNPSTEFWVLPKTYPLRKYIYTKSKKSNKEALCVTNQSHPWYAWAHEQDDLQVKQPWRVSLRHQGMPSTRELSLFSLLCIYTMSQWHPSVIGALSSHLLPNPETVEYLWHLCNILKCIFPSWKKKLQMALQKIREMICCNLTRNTSGKVQIH